jgi:SAM-dependent methyltransferase
VIFPDSGGRIAFGMEHLDIVPHFLAEPGVEIGAFKTPIPGIQPIYVDRFHEFAHEPTKADYYGDACALPFHDSSLRYVATSHVIEHVANPLAAIREWYRVLRHRGIIYMVVPDRRMTWDQPRPLTPVEHSVEDFRRGVTQVDGTHIDDFAFGVDWSRFSPDTPAHAVEAERRAMADRFHTAIADGKEINIHFHTYEPDSMARLVALADTALGIPGRISVERVIPDFPTSDPVGFLVVARVRKSLRERIHAVLARVTKHRSPLRADAQPF